MRETTLKAYKIAEESGLLNNRRMQVFKDICVHGPCTELDSWRRISPNSNSGVITTRFSELKRMGVIEIAGERKDEVTQAYNKLWDVTGKTPVKLEKVTPKSVMIHNSALDSVLKEVQRRMCLPTVHPQHVGYAQRVMVEDIVGVLRKE